MRKAEVKQQASSQGVFDFESYRAYLQAHLQRQGRGEQGRLAKAAGISTSLLSLILSEQKNLSLEQATELVDYLNLPELDSDYFLTLVEIDRAGSTKLQNRLRKKLRLLKEQSVKVSRRVKKDTELSEQALSIYYSSWMYTGIRNFASIGEGKTQQEVMSRFGLSPQQVQQVVQFCLDHGLLVQQQNRYSFGAKNTHVGNDSPWVNNHHRNWRNQAIQQMEKRREQDLFYTCPMSLSQEAATEIRALLPEFIQQVLKIVGPSPSEKVMCWNMDWFEY